ncbi:hypothetical protein QR680_000022 [Steinernema hermaphroditum]|uniref:Dymeclin n=1 Tax=Steinernema hermaphroditum TaxID=289476 RepID=A0AA39GTR6_9BILA|nr:hypothetical protein QR680_000022 [Steinernema hermaphroditum]
MGGVISSSADVANNQWIRRLAGLQPISDNDPFWNQLFSFNYAVDEMDTETVRELEETVDDVLQALMYNTETTGNFGALIRVFLRRSSELGVSEMCDNKIFLWQTANALIIIRYVCRTLTQRLSETEFSKAFSSKEFVGSNAKTQDALDDLEHTNCATSFFDVLLSTIANLPVNIDVDNVAKCCRVINHFASRVQSLANSTVSEVLDVISKAAIQWPTDRLKKFPDLKFKYVEDENTVDFFVPYIWRLVLEEAGVYWDPDSIKIIGK